MKNSKLKRTWQHLRRPVSGQKGMALFIAMVTIVLIMYLTMEVTYETSVDYIVNAQVVNKLKARYAAKAGLEISLLRIKIFQQAQAALGKSMGSSAAMLDEIWQFPLAWPPVLPDETNKIDKDAVKKIVNESSMQASWRADIKDEGSRIDINDLASPSEQLRKSTREQLENIFKSKIEDDEEWSKDNRDFPYKEILNNITDWLDKDSVTIENQAEESSIYKGAKGLPPNRNFRTIDEIRLVKGVTDEFFDVIAPRITIYGMKGINPNYAPKEVLMSLDVQVKEEIAQKIIERRDDPNLGPFEKAQDFWDFLDTLNVRIDDDVKKKIPIITDSVQNFRIISTGYFGSGDKIITSEIVAIVYDIDKIGTRVGKLMKEEETAKNPPPAGATGPTPGKTGADGTTPGGDSGSSDKQSEVAKGPPRIVYYSEK
ncbi:MAG: general secretion pathway protein GspK [Pseudobdellovibrionaceae bacterium]